MKRTSSTGWPRPEEPGRDPDSLGPTTRFTSRADAYARGRPGYPAGLFDHLSSALGLRRHHVVLDVGSGTGMLTAPLLDLGVRVIAVEPNAAMRAHAEARLGHEPRFRSVEGTAERTGLPDDAVDFVMAGQAFHWFDPERAALELGRVLRTDGWGVLVWNVPARGGHRFTDAYVSLLHRWGRGYGEIAARHGDPAAMRAFFRDGAFASITLPHVHELDVQGWRDRIDSTSYLPAPDEADHGPMIREVESLFADHQRDGRVHIRYDARVFWGHL